MAKREVTVATFQMSCTWDRQENIQKAEKFIRQAAEQGAQIVLVQELFETPYFCSTLDPDYNDLATELENYPAVNHFKNIAKELSVVLPISFFERKNNAKYNSIAIIDADGSILGVYRKSHIPDGPGYQEKFYFNPGDTGIQVWKTKYATIGVLICWDQWFPEPARASALMGAELLFYPSAIGSEPTAPNMDTKPHWQLCMQGHSACNMVPVIACNRVGVEKVKETEITFYGSSFITNNQGEKIKEANRSDEQVLVATFDLNANQKARDSWGMFRDRRPDLYNHLSTLDGQINK
jgi:N-carbamoylputrescine amidase